MAAAHLQQGECARFPAGEAAGIDGFAPCYDCDRLSNQAIQVLRKRTKQALRIRVVGKQVMT